MNKGKIRTFEAVLIFVFFIGTIVFIGSLMYFSKKTAVTDSGYAVSSVGRLLEKLSLPVTNNEDIQYTLSISEVAGNPPRYIDKTVIWQGKVVETGENDYKGGKIRVFKISSPEAVEFFAGAKSETAYAAFSAGDTVSVKGIIRAIYSADGENFVVLQYLTLEAVAPKEAASPGPTPSTPPSATPEPANSREEPLVIPEPVPSQTYIAPPPPQAKETPKKTSTPAAKQPAKVGPKPAPSFEYKYSDITALDQKYLKIAESYDNAKNKKKALRYYKKYLEVAPQGAQSEAVKNKVKELEGK